MAPKRKELLTSPVKAKKSKKDPVADKLHEIVAAVGQADVSAEVEKMLAAIVPLALGEFSELRHPFQKRVVEGLAGLLSEVEASLKKEVLEKRAARDGATKDLPQRQQEATDAESALNAKIKEVHAAKVVLAEKATVFRSARAALATAEEAKVEDGQKAREAEKLKSDFLGAQDKLNILKATPPEDKEGKKATDGLVSLLKKHKFEESMLIALPAALAKKPEERGQFDAMAISQLEGEIAKMVAEQDAVITAAIPSQEKCDAAIKQAEAALNTARGDQRAAAKEFDLLSKAQSECTEASSAAQKAVKDLTNQLKKHEKALHNAEAEVDVFQEGALETFKQLRDRVVPPVEEEPEAGTPAKPATPMKDVAVPEAAEAVAMEA